jgi:hypothetical protein
MRVLLEFSRGGLEKHREAIELLRALTLESGHILTNDLVDESKVRPDSLPEGVYYKLQRAIANAHCVIIEGSVVSLSLGFVLTEAINLGKPVLFLIKEESFNQRNRFAASIESKLLTYKSYASEDELQEIVGNFFKHHNEIRTRFNLVLSNYLNSYITVESQKKGISKTEYIIELIEEDERQRNGG